ncbi:hypothetical protein D3C78_1910100 [compost metagenome]
MHLLIHRTTVLICIGINLLVQVRFQLIIFRVDGLIDFLRQLIMNRTFVVRNLLVNLIMQLRM